VGQKLRELLDLALPTECIGCGGHGGGVLCGDCLPLLVKSRPLSWPDDFTLGREELGLEAGVAGWRAAGLYHGLLKELVLRLKSSCRHVATPLSIAMVAAAGNDPAFLVPDMVCFVPSSREKVVSRGYNPAELLARAVSERLGRPLMQCLAKTRATLDQDGLPGYQRLSNVSGAFGATRILEPRSSVLLVDDVLTTGATARACSGALLAAGAHEVRVLVAARAAMRGCPAGRG
jgi:predicted amidophosphoribosyltransferase